MSVYHSYLKLISLSHIFALIDACGRKQLLKFHLAVKIDLVEIVNYLKLFQLGISFAI